MRKIDPYSILERIDAFAWLNQDVYTSFVEIASLELYQPREVVFQGSEKGEYLYIVVSGNLQIFKSHPKGDQLLAVLREEEIFGTRFLYGKSPEHETLCIASSPTLLMAIPVQEMREIISSSTECRETYCVVREYYDAYQFIKNSTSLGDQLSPKFLIHFAGSFQKKDYAENVFVFKQGDAPDGYYICSRGQFEITVEVEQRIVFRSTIKAGDYFGELALTTNSKRSGSIKALTDSECYFLSREVFDDLVQKEPQLLEGFQLLAKLAYG